MKQNGFFARVVKTTIVNVDEESHHLPPDGGSYSEHKVADYFCPEEWSNDGIFIPVKEGDPLWFDFTHNNEECAILCAVQRLNPVTGEPADLEAGLSKDPNQNYLSMPRQKWLDGYAKDGKVYQFVVTKAGVGLAVNEYVLPKHMQDSHAIGFAFFSPKNPKPKVVYRRSMGPQYLSKKYGSAGITKGLDSTWSGGETISTSGGLTSNNCNYSADSIEVHEIDSDAVFGASASDDIGEISCNAALDVDGDLILGAHGDHQRFTQNRVADNYNEVLDERPDIETVDILAAQEKDLTELDKASMGAGGRIIQEITTDENTTDYYHEKRSALLTIYFALPEMFDTIMKKGKRQDASRKDKYKTSGHIGGVAVPLVIQEEAEATQ